MKGYKAFEHGMICNGKQYAENTVFEEDSAVVCRGGTMSLFTRLSNNKTQANRKQIASKR